MAKSTNNFTSSDTSGDKLSFNLWQQSRHREESAAVLKKRKAELYALVRKVIRNELDPTQQAFVRMRWYEGRDLKYISRELKLDVSTVSRKEKVINNIIYDKLKYALEYKYGKAFSEKSTEFIRSNPAACCPVEGRSISERLVGLRIRRDLTQKELSCATGISKKRIELIESDAKEISIDEVRILCGFYGVTTDYIIIGTAS